MELPPVSRFTCSGESPSELSLKWDRWKRSFRYYIEGKGIAGEGRRRALLLHCAGPQVQDLFETLGDTGETCDSAIAALDGYFKPLVNKFYERYRFRPIRQDPGESVDQFVSRLRQQATKCEFADVDQNVIDQVIEKCEGSRVRSKLLEEGNKLTLEKALFLARTVESVSAQEKDIASQSGQIRELSTDTAMALTVKSSDKRKQPSGRARQQSARQSKQCYRCGFGGHLPNESTCRARKAECNKCGKVGHYARMCQFKGKTQRQETSFLQMRMAARTMIACTMSQIQSMSSQSIRNAQQHRSRLVESRQRLIDSGACSNIMPSKQFCQLKRRGLKYKQYEVKKTLYAYGSSTPLKVVGGFETDVRSEDAQTLAQFIVVDCSGPTLLGRKTSPALRLLTLGCVQEAATATNRKDLLEQYGQCVSGLGKLKEFQLKLHINEHVKPVAQQARRIPFGLRAKVEEELNHLLEADVIEPAHGPTPWTSPVVVVPKPNGDVRLCVDMRRVNEAIIRERHPIPTVDEVVAELSHSKHFSKLDLRKGYHQIELHEESRPITTFVTHRGLFRYKRLMFGISSAPEMYHHIIQQVLQGCQGATNISDDIIVHGQTQQEHDERLHAVLKRLTERGLTINEEKCQFDMDRLKFMGHVISKEAISSAEDKIAAIKAAREPQTATEVRSFLGLVNFCARFIPNLATVADALRQCRRTDKEFQWRNR